jgi:hypothetical protein
MKERIKGGGLYGQDLYIRDRAYKRLKFSGNGRLIDQRIRIPRHSRLFKILQLLRLIEMTS